MFSLKNRLNNVPINNVPINNVPIKSRPKFLFNKPLINTTESLNNNDKPPYRNRVKIKNQQKEEKERKVNKMKEKFSEYISLPDEKYYTNFKKEDVTILLQGILNKDVDIFETIELYSLSGHIVLSVYDDEYTKNICNRILELYPNDVSVVYNNLETYQKEFEEIKKRYNERIINNFYFQFKTTINGLQTIHTKYVVKSRVDHYYSDIDKLIAHGIVTKKLVSSSLHIRGLFDKRHPTYYFHMSDSLFFGETIKIKQMLYLANQMSFTSIMMEKGAEVRLWKPYLIMLAESEGLKLDDTHIKHGEDYEYMLKYVHFLNSKITVYPANLHNSFKIKFGNNFIFTKNDKAPIYSSLYYFIEGVGDTMDNIILKNKYNVIFILSGNCRTFIDCIDTCYNNIISKLFSNETIIYIYLYLKLTDPGPKGYKNWDFIYESIEYTTLMNKINEMKNLYKDICIEYKILEDNEISDNDLLSQVKCREKYNGYYSEDSKLVRGMHSHYNFECCGKYILEKEEYIKSKFDYIIYIRPDLYFTKKCNSITTYSDVLVTLGTGPHDFNNDHLAIIPRTQFKKFFFDRMNLYRNNTIDSFKYPEEVYRSTIQYNVLNIGKYYIKRT